MTTFLPRICVVTIDPALGGGVLTKLREYLDYADSRGFRCDLYYPTESGAPAGHGSGLDTHPAVDRIEPVHVPTWMPHHLRTTLFSRRVVLAGRYDAHHVISGSLSQALPLARMERTFIASVACTFASEVHGIAGPSITQRLLYNPMAVAAVRHQERYCARRAACILVDSRCSAAQMRSELAVEDSRMRVVPSPVDIESFTPGEPGRRGRRYVLSVGRLDRRKDVATLIDAFAHVAPLVADVDLRIVGDGRERSRLERRIVAHGLCQRVRLLGTVGVGELRAQYRGASLFALASRQEGIGIVLLEALASGLPIVATDSGGARDAVEHGETGLLTRPGDAPALARCLRRLLVHDQAAANMRTAARRKAVREFSREVIHRRLDDAYRLAFGIEPRRDGMAAA